MLPPLNADAALYASTNRYVNPWRGGGLVPTAAKAKTCGLTAAADCNSQRTQQLAKCNQAFCYPFCAAGDSARCSSCLNEIQTCTDNANATWDACVGCPAGFSCKDDVALPDFLGYTAKLDTYCCRDGTVPCRGECRPSFCSHLYEEFNRLTCQCECVKPRVRDQDGNCVCLSLCPDDAPLQLSDCTCIPCPTGLTQCGRYCFNLSSDRHNCGQCGNTCLPDQTCCEGSCTTMAEDPDCGFCGNDCSSRGQVCCDHGYQSVYAPPGCCDPQQCCNGYCCSDGTVCMGGKACCHPDTDDWCGECCPKGGCCENNTKCCPLDNYKHCTNDHCCKSGQEWCGECCTTGQCCNGVCCPDGQSCSSGHCCPTGNVWTGTRCCPSAYACGNDCCSSTDHCSNNHCCANGLNWCGNQCCDPAKCCTSLDGSTKTCCPQGTLCSNGVCCLPNYVGVGGVCKCATKVCGQACCADASTARCAQNDPSFCCLTNSAFKVPVYANGQPAMAVQGGPAYACCPDPSMICEYTGPAPDGVHALCNCQSP